MIELLQRPIRIGPLNIPPALIALLIAWVIYRLIISRFYRGRAEQLKDADGIISNAFFILLIGWKLSPLIFQFSTVLRSPSAAFFLPGGIEGTVLGASAALVYCLIVILRHRAGRKILLKNIVLNACILAVLIVLSASAVGIVSGKVFPDESSSAAASGMQAPVFSMAANDGSEYSLSDYRGRTVILNFWASWCPPCKAELPELKTFYKDTDPAETVLLSINMYTTENNKEALPAFIEDEGIEYPVLFDYDGGTAAAYGVISIPTTVVINGDGVIMAVRTGAVTEAWLNRVKR